MEKATHQTAVEKGSSLWHDAWLRLRQNLFALAGLVVTALATLLCFVGPWLSPFPSAKNFSGLENAAPLVPVYRIVVAGEEPPRERFTTPADLAKRWDPERGNPILRLDTPQPADWRAELARLAADQAVTVGPWTIEPTPQRHLLGNDALGRDLLVRLLEGGQISITVGVLATLVTITIGVLYGSVAAYFGGAVDAVMMRVVDILYALPFTIFVILLMVMFGREFWLIFVGIGAVSWLNIARIVRGQALSVRKQEYVEAAVSMGYSNARIILRHVIPNLLGPVVIYSTLAIPQVILLESFLSFLGLGVQPPAASWGTLISEGAQVMRLHPHLLLAPAVLFFLTLLSLNYFGDGLRDALDPRAAKD